jgi:elongation factor P--beta-lysine ligase
MLENIDFKLKIWYYRKVTILVTPLKVCIIFRRCELLNDYEEVFFNYAGYKSRGKKEETSVLEHYETDARLKKKAKEDIDDLFIFLFRMSLTKRRGAEYANKEASEVLFDFFFDDD